ncbi:MAG: hypothetical protein ACOX6Z_04875 [Dethiobacteria bacterium]|jgi:hypothetical protein
MAGPAIDPVTGEFLQPGLCPINPETEQRECPPTNERDCLVVEKVFDQCFTEDNIVRRFEIPCGPGEPCERIDLRNVNRVECEVLNAECIVVDVSLPINDNMRIVTLRQDVKVKIDLWHDPVLWASASESGGGGGPYKPRKLCTFTETITDFFNQITLYVPPPGILFGTAGGPFLFCEVVSSTCYCSPETVPPGEPVSHVICNVKVCKIVDVTAFVKLMIPLYGYCIPRPCEAGPQPEIECPPVDSLFPPQQETGNNSNNNDNG